MRRFCEALPADRLLQGNDCDLDSALAKEKSMRRYMVDETGATLTYTSSLVVLAHYVSSLVRISCTPDTASVDIYQRRRSDPVLQPIFVMTVENKRFICEVLLPEHAPIPSAVGKPSSRKAIAKRSAAFEMCVKLRQADHLDKNLISTAAKYRNEWANIHVAITSVRTTKYPMKIKPRLWESTRGSLPERLYLTVFQLAEPEKHWRRSQPLALVTRTPMPYFPPMLLHLPTGKASQTISTSITKCLGVTELIVRKLNNFTLRVWNDIYAKKFDNSISNASYWFAPILMDTRVEKDVPNPASLIDWTIVDSADIHNIDNPIQWTPNMPDTELEARFVIHPLRGERRFYTAKVDSTLRPADEVPKNAHQGTGYVKNILDYSFKSDPGPKTAKREGNLDQPVIQAHLIYPRRNWFDEQNDSKSKDPEALCYICPEPMHISPVSEHFCLSYIMTDLSSYLYQQ